MIATLRPGPALRERTTIGIGGICLAEAVLHTEQDLDQLAAFLAAEPGRPFVIGAGSNLLAADRGLDLVLIQTKNSEFMIKDLGDSALVRVGAGMKLPVLLSKLHKAGLGGLEGLAGIPGTVGGALAMNAGSWGVEMADRVKRAALWTPLVGLSVIEREDMQFGYRSFNPGLAGKWLAWALELVLPRADSAAIQQAMTENMNKKKAAQPMGESTAGCVFKNPDGMSAGKLLDQAGMKGKAVGDMEFSGLHANFLVNRGKGTFAQAMELLDTGKEAVAKHCGITLETEVIILT
ncbi:MAG: UDP-N-acetylmuramate dehydrogenase [Proteobacteria bacterium]|nr:UDP-N-acetylmuramate dehydrogenase [Pseudomonadota bacterium]